MERIHFSTEGSTPFEQLLGHNKNILKEWSNLENALFNSNTFSRELKEEI
ncbi:MAG TPA: alkylhydroperoxidase, partial [Clostridium sp.]|nr:alkylhydroperoxidase [Clostridium sp.]